MDNEKELNALKDAIKESWLPDRKANVSQALIRQGARDLLHQRIHQLREEANSLEALNNALPLKLSPAADDALFELLSRHG